MTVYRYDLYERENTQGGLSQLSSEFEAASTVREGAEGAMGYDSLRDAISEFTENWKNNREKQLPAATSTSSGSTAATSTC